LADVWSRCDDVVSTARLAHIFDGKRAANFDFGFFGAEC
jgi:hypothetical protein